MPGIDSELMSHRLAVYPGSRPVQERRRKLGPERAQVVEEQVQALLEAGFIREFKYPAWLVNVVLVKKQNGKWRMCVDYTNLNKACLKDPYPLPNIDVLVDSSSGCQFEWAPECEEAFQEFKKFLNQPPVLTRPKAGEELVLYLAIAKKAVASALIREDEVGQHPIYFTSKCLIDFIAEYAGDQEEASKAWEIYVDGSSNKVRSGAGIILVNQEGTQIEVSLKFEFPASNNQAEYEALIAGLKLAKEVGATKVIIFSNSQVVTSQINGEYQAKDPNMKRYLEKTLEHLRQFLQTEVRHITRELNNRVNALSKLASTKPGENNRSLIQETLQKPSVTKTDSKPDVLSVSGLDLRWITPLVEYLKFD
ncbi:uncharacterized protein [Arachis hypogaea]|uniref:uncharacterized protein n=1 Tax=Arachis hypogaea TaxID=3818 RepID=UPI003B2232A0